MNWSIFSSLSSWYLVAAGITTFILIIGGFMYTYLRQKKDTVPAASGCVMSARTQTLDAQLNENKWPTGSGKEVVKSGSKDKLSSDPSGADPVEYCSHIQRQVKKTQQRIAQQKIEATMTREQRDEEREVQRKQLEEIFRLMEEQKERFGVSDVTDVKEQLKLYVQ